VTSGGDLWDVRDALCWADKFIDELLRQSIVSYAASLRLPVQSQTVRWSQHPFRSCRADLPLWDRQQ